MLNFLILHASLILMKNIKLITLFLIIKEFHPKKEEKRFYNKPNELINILIFIFHLKLKRILLICTFFTNHIF